MAVKLFQSEQQRLISFEVWPADEIVSGRSLAAAGWFYMGVDDHVKCEFCGGAARNWQPGDTALGEHRRLFPDCPFLQQGAFHDLGQEIAKNALDSTSTLTRKSKRTLLESYATTRSRLATFSTWPPDHVISPEALAEAGFVYTGCRDETKCVYCEGCLQLWQPGDDPTTEHQRHFPRCSSLCDTLRKELKTISNLTQEAERPPDISSGFQKTANLGEVRVVVDCVPSSARAARYIDSEQTSGYGSMNKTSSSSQTSDIETALNCKVCLEKQISTLLRPCRHLVCCDACSLKITACPVCRGPIRYTEKVYL